MHKKIIPCQIVLVFTISNQKMTCIGIIKSHFLYFELKMRHQFWTKLWFSGYSFQDNRIPLTALFCKTLLRILKSIRLNIQLMSIAQLIFFQKPKQSGHSGFNHLFQIRFGSVLDSFWLYLGLVRVLFLDYTQSHKLLELNEYAESYSQPI